MNINWMQILGFIKQFLPEGISSLFNFTKEKIISKTLHSKVKEYLIKIGREMPPVLIVSVRDSWRPKNKQVFNDVMILIVGKEYEAYWITSEPGMKWTPANMKKYGITWVGLYPKGYYEKNFQLRTKKGHPRFYQIGKVKLMEIKNNKPIGLRKGGNCDIHHTSSNKTEASAVGFSSAGCQTHRELENLEDMADLYRSSKQYKRDKKFKADFLVVDKGDISLTGVEIV